MGHSNKKLCPMSFIKFIINSIAIYNNYDIL